MTREACALVFQVTNIGEGYVKCQFLYDDLIDFGGNRQPDLKNIDLGGMSGCPVFSVDSVGQDGLLVFPRLCGVFTDRWGSDPTTDIIEIATFEKVHEGEFRS